MKRWALAIALTAACSPKTEKQQGLAPPPKDIVRTMVTVLPHVKLRESASVDANTINEIPIAQRVLELEPTKGEWEHVSSRKMQRGWVLASEVRPLNNEHPEDTYLAIWRERFGNAKLDFDERAALFEALQQVENESNDAERKGTLELARILTLKAALALIDPDSAKKSPHKEFLEQNRAILVYDEPEREWNPIAAQLWSSAITYKATSSGESIAWEAASTPLPGDCEGDFGCAIDLVNQTAGRYLGMFPEGKSASLALRRYASLEAPANDTLDDASIKDIKESLDKATAIIAKCKADASRKAAEAALERVQKALDTFAPPE
jgi:hypothetical protein